MLVFNEKFHTYYWEELGNRRELLSVSKFLKKYKPAFEKQKIAEIYAQKHNMSIDVVLDNWAQKGKKSTDYGTFIHNSIRHYLLDKTIPCLLGETLQYLKFLAESELPKKSYAVEDLVIRAGDRNIALFSFLHQWTSKHSVHSLEKAICDLELGIAGTYDCLFQNKETGKYILIDWKTNKKIKMNNRWQKLLAPLNYLDDCEYINYSLQLSIYKYMIEKQGIEVSNMYIFHILDNIKMIEVFYMKNEIDLFVKKICK